jgi:polar amino acid transport system substrate-binding protein
VATKSGWSAEPLEVLTADVRPLSIADGPRRGIVLDIVREALRAVGHEAHFTFLPFAEALQKTQARAGTLMAPLARSPQREQNFTWIAKVVDVPQAMGTLRGKPTVDLDGARRLARIGIVKGDVQESFLKETGFANLVPFGSAREAAEALAAGQIDAWYATATEIVLQFEAVGRPGTASVGPAIQVVPVWLAGNKDTASIPVDAVNAAVVRMERSGAIDRIFRSYVPT